MKLSLRLGVVLVMALSITQQTAFAATTPIIPTIKLSTNLTTTFNRPGLLSPSAGWGLSESQGTWAILSEASMNLTFPKFSKEAVIAFSSWGMVTSKNPTVTLTIFVNTKTPKPVGTFIYNATYDKGVRLFDVPIDLLKGNLSNVPFLFKITGNQSPHNLGLSSDKRTLGVYLQDITLKYIS